MQALSYENLLRRIYQVGRRGIPEADADVYRRLEHSERAFTFDSKNIRDKQPRISTKSLEDLEYKYRVQCSKIWRIVSEALRTGITRYKTQLSEADVQTLKKSMEESDRITKETIDAIIKTAEKIFTSHQIFAP